VGPNTEHGEDFNRSFNSIMHARLLSPYLALEGDGSVYDSAYDRLAFSSSGGGGGSHILSHQSRQGNALTQTEYCEETHFLKSKALGGNSDYLAVAS